MQIRYPDIEKTLIPIQAEDIFKLLGEKQECADTHTSALVIEYIDKCLRLSSPTGAIAQVQALQSKTSLEINIPGMTFHTGKIIGKMLRHSEAYTLFLVTAGPEPENLARKLLEEGNYLEGYIADLVASVLVESVADSIQKQIRSQAKDLGMQITNRYSPGYCAWDVSEQQKLFSLFPEMCCGISLSESSLMNPVKSASGIIGMGSRVEYREYTCEICSMKNCQFRKKKIS
jgi:Vitamin B12 dependent methionine synthase, activation domain